jgi:DNA-binding XRE family transcriptional regulator
MFDNNMAMQSSNKDLARMVKEYRLSREMTQNQAAALFRVSVATYVRVENGKGCGDLTRSKITKLLVQAAQAA